MAERMCPFQPSARGSWNEDIVGIAIARRIACASFSAFSRVGAVISMRMQCNVARCGQCCTDQGEEL
jgi:hypothetical protein